MSSSGRKEEKRKDGTKRRRYEGDMSKLINIYNYVVSTNQTSEKCDFNFVHEHTCWNETRFINTSTFRIFWFVDHRRNATCGRGGGGGGVGEGHIWTI